MGLLENKILNRVHLVIKPFCNLSSGSSIYCFAETHDCYWILLPRPWLGHEQIKVDKKLLLQSIKIS